MGPPFMQSQSPSSYNGLQGPTQSGCLIIPLISPFTTAVLALIQFLLHRACIPRAWPSTLLSEDPSVCSFLCLEHIVHSTSSSPSVSQFHCPFHREALPEHTTGRQPPLFTSVLAPCVSSNSFLEHVIYLLASFMSIPHSTLSPIRSGAISVSFATKQPLLSTAFGAHQLSINAYPITEWKCSVCLWSNYNGKFIF